MRTFYIRTFGCQMNEHDSDRMAQQLVAHGLQPVDEARSADLILINSCSVRAKPENKALSECGRHQHARKARGVRIVLTGCVAQQHGASLLDRAEYLDAVIGPDAIVRLPELVSRLEAGETRLLDVQPHDAQQPCFVPLGPAVHESPKQNVTIMKGCDNHCAYCIVPLVRGLEVSRPLRDILAEVERLAVRGVREVTLLGQNVNSYRDPSGAADFPQLLRALDRQGAIPRIRFTTSHPKDLGEELVEAMAELDSVMPHLHLALQSGSDRILQRMNRGYTSDDFLHKSRSLRQAIPGIALTTDLIVGFPGEEDSDFQSTCRTVEQVAFDGAYSFKYSPRPGTPAAVLKDDVPHLVKSERLTALQALIERLAHTSLSSLTNRCFPVMVEGSSLRDPEAFTGRTPCNRVVNFTTAGKPAIGMICEVRIAEVRGHTLWGRCPCDDTQ